MLGVVCSIFFFSHYLSLSIYRSLYLSVYPLFPFSLLPSQYTTSIWSCNIVLVFSLFSSVYPLIALNSSVSLLLYLPLGGPQTLGEVVLSSLYSLFNYLLISLYNSHHDIGNDVVQILRSNFHLRFSRRYERTANPDSDGKILAGEPWRVRRVRIIPLGIGRRGGIEWKTSSAVPFLFSLVGRCAWIPFSISAASSRRQRN